MNIVSSMLDLMRRLPPTKIEETVEALMQISPDYADDLSGTVDQCNTFVSGRIDGG
jgi:capping protein beta